MDLRPGSERDGIPDPDDLVAAADDALDDSDNEGGDDIEDGEVPAPILSGRVKDKDTDEEEDKRKKKRRFLAFMCCVTIAIIFVLVLMISLFATQPGGTATSQVDQEETSAPSLPPIEEESPAPTQQVTTPPPTFDPNVGPRSARSCTEITTDESLQVLSPGTPFKTKFLAPDGRSLCGDTYVGFPRNPDRNPWTALLGQDDCETANFEDGTAICEEVGARRCTADELQFAVAQGTGCNGDNTLLYSSTPCTEGEATGIFKVNLELKKNFATFFECETDLSVETLTRCCADDF